MTFCMETATDAAALALPYGEGVDLDQADVELADTGSPKHSEVEVMGIEDVRAFWTRLMTRN